MSIAQRERAALVDSLRDVGPEAPTLCEGWKRATWPPTLMIREYRLDAAPASSSRSSPATPPRCKTTWLSRPTGTSWSIRSHPARRLYSPFKLLDPLVNVGEMFIDHEDVRRAQPAGAARARTCAGHEPAPHPAADGPDDAGQGARPAGAANPRGQDGLTAGPVQPSR